MNKKQITVPDLTDVIEGAIDDLIYSFNCHRVGIIESFNPADQTATIQLVDKGVKTFSDAEELITYPLLVDCPVVINKGINGGLTIPINKGDTCLVFFNDRDIDNWFTDGLIQQPNTTRAHDLADAIALVGIRNGINKIGDYNNQATELNYLDNKVSIGKDKTQITRSEGGFIGINDKIEVKNATQSLKLLIDELVAIITNLKTVDPISGLLPIDGTTASSLSALSTKVDELLK